MLRRFGPAILLISLVSAGLFVESGPAAAHPFHLEIDNPTAIGPEEVNGNRWVAQSFVPGDGFIVTRVSLWVRDRGSPDPLNVSIRESAAGVPGAALSSGSTFGPSVAFWLDVDVSPRVSLSPAQTYWIVARSNASGGSGYDWWNSGDDAAYVPGTGAVSPDGSSWSGAGKDYSFRVFGFRQPGFTFGVSVSDATLNPGQSTDFRVNFTNSGAGDAAAAWVNLSLAPELVYLFDDSANVGGTRSGSYSFSFTNVAPGSYAFNVTASAIGGVTNGTVVTSRFTFEGTDHNGLLSSQSSRDIDVTLRNARVVLVLRPNPVALDPGDSMSANLTVTNVGRVDAADVRIETNVDSNATYASSAPLGVYDSGSRTLRWIVPSIASGAQVSVEWSGQIPPGTVDGASVSIPVRVDYRDPTGASLPPETTSATLVVRAPVILPELQVDRTSAEFGDEVTASLFFNNTGTAPAPVAWTNWSLGGHFGLVSLSPAVTPSATPDGFSVMWTNVTPGNRALLARLRVLRGMADGLNMSLEVRSTATDANGNRILDTLLLASVGLRAPSVSLTLAGSDRQVRVGQPFALNVTIRNSGRAVATAWLNLTLPTGAVYVADNGSYPVTVGSGRVMWRIPALAAGAVTFLGVTLRADSVSGAQAARFTVNYTDGRGSAAREISSNAVLLEFVAGGLAFDNLPWSAVLAFFVIAAAGVAIRLVSRRFGRAIVEDVFVIDFRGTLLAHRSSTSALRHDEDILAGMLTTVQAFIQDAFSPATEEHLKTMGFGDRKILIERGRQHYVAVVYRGEDRGHLARRIEKLSSAIDRRYGGILVDWDGDMDTIRELDPMLSRLPMQRSRVAPASSGQK